MSPAAIAQWRLTARMAAQVKIFGGYTRWAFDMPPPSAAAPARMALTIIDAAHRHAVAPQPGPVHINVQLREPLSPVQQPWPPEVLQVAGQSLCGSCVVPLAYCSISICYAWLGAAQLQVFCCKFLLMMPRVDMALIRPQPQHFLTCRALNAGRGLTVHTPPMPCRLLGPSWPAAQAPQAPLWAAWPRPGEAWLWWGR